MLRPSAILVGVFLLQLSYQAYAMKCQLPLGLEMSCPTMFYDDDKAFCCHSKDNVPYCCDIGEYITNNSAVIAGILVGGLIILIVVTICCCCFCSCCYLARRRTQRGTVIYAPVSAAPVVPPTSLPVSSPVYPHQPGFVVHAPPPSSQSPPPYPYETSQPPINPNYKY